MRRPSFLMRPITPSHLPSCSAASMISRPRALRGGHVARPEDRGAEVLLDLVVKGQKGQQREITPAIVVPIEEGELLRAMGRIIGRIEIDRDASDPPMEPLPMALNH